MWVSGFGSDCYLHFRSLSSKKRRRLVQKVAMGLDEICELILHVEIIVVLRRFGDHADKIVNTMIQLRERHSVDRTVLGSGFKYYVGNRLDKVGSYILDDKAMEVQVADILANVYR